MKHYIVKILKNGAVQQTQEVVGGAGNKGAFILKAASGSKYELMDVETKLGPRKIAVKHSGKDLLISFEDGSIEHPDVIIQDYYATDHGAVTGQAESGKYCEYIPESGNGFESIAGLAPDLTSSQVLAVSSATALASEGLGAGAIAAIIGGVAAVGAGVGIALASGSGNKSVAQSDPPATPTAPVSYNGMTKTRNLFLAVSIFAAFAASSQAGQPTADLPSAQFYNFNNNDSDSGPQALDGQAVVVMYREFEQDNRPLVVSINQRLMGVVLPGRYTVTTLCAGDYDITITERGQFPVSSKTVVRMQIVAGRKLYFVLQQKSDRTIDLNPVAQATALRLLPSLQGSHVVGRIISSCAGTQSALSAIPPSQPKKTTSILPAVIAPVAQAPSAMRNIIEPRSGILFAYNSSELSDIAPEEMKRLSSLVKDLQGMGTKLQRLRIVGHADRIGSEEENQILSLNRAKTVALYLRRHGIKSPIHAVGLGSQEPIATNCANTGASGRPSKELIACLAPDRRVTVEILKWEVADVKAN